MNWRNRRGLSLMELLVALTLVAVITGALATSTRFGVQLLDRTSALQVASPEIALRTRLRHWMTTATPPTRLASFPTNLVGTTTQVSFTTLAPAHFAPNSAALRVTITASGDALLLKIDELSDLGEVIATFDRTLASNVTGAQIRYYSDDLEGPGWQTSWENVARLPRLIQITTDDGSTPPWPEFTVNLALAQ